MRDLKILIASATLAASAVACLSTTAIADEIHIPYSLAAGATSGPIPIPAENTPVSLTCVNNALDFRGVGQMTVLRVLPNSFLMWVGIDFATAPDNTIENGFSATAGTHMIWCDAHQTVDIRVNSSTDIQIHNAGFGTATGVITAIW